MLISTTAAVDSDLRTMQINQPDELTVRRRLRWWCNQARSCSFGSPEDQTIEHMQDPRMVPPYLNYNIVLVILLRCYVVGVVDLASIVGSMH
jgi:hypothetical protein